MSARTEHHTTPTPARPSTIEPVAETYSELSAPRSAYMSYLLCALLCATVAVTVTVLVIARDPVNYHPLLGLTILAGALVTGWICRGLVAMRDEANLFNAVDDDVAWARRTGNPVRPVARFTEDHTTEALR